MLLLASPQLPTRHSNVKNYVSSAGNLDLPAPAAVTSGDVMIVGGVVGIASTTETKGSLVSMATSGIYDLPRRQGDGLLRVGEILYWDAPHGAVTTDHAAGPLLGHVWRAARAEDARVHVRLMTFAGGQTTIIDGEGTPAPVPQFMPTRSNIYAAVRDILSAGPRIILDENDTLRGIVIDALEFDPTGVTQTIEGYSYNSSFGIRTGQFHVGVANDALRLSLALKASDTLQAEILTPGTVVTFGEHEWQIVELLSGDGTAGTSITFIVSNITHNESIAGTGNLTFANGVYPRINALKNFVENLRIPEAFTPTQQNIYAAVKAILQAGTNTSITPNDGAFRLALNALATGGGSFTPTQQNIYAAVKAILVPGRSTDTREDDSTQTIAIDYDTDQNVRGQLSFLYSDGTNESISRFHPVQLRRLFGTTSGMGITATARRTDIRFLISGFIPGFTALSQLVHFQISGQSARDRATPLEKGEYIGGNVYYNGTLVQGNFALIGTLTNQQIDNLISNPSDLSLDVRYRVNSQEDIWSLRIPALTPTEATANPIVPHIPNESIIGGVDIDEIGFARATTELVNGSWQQAIRLNLNSPNTRSAVTNVIIPTRMPIGTYSAEAITNSRLRYVDTGITMPSGLANQNKITVQVQAANLTDRSSHSILWEILNALPKVAAGATVTRGDSWWFSDVTAAGASATDAGPESLFQLTARNNLLYAYNFSGATTSIRNVKITAYVE